MVRLNRKFFQRDVLDVAPDLLGKILVRKFEDGRIEKFTITETEGYRGEEDLACHASKGKTERTKVMYEEGGVIYVYLIYGMYWMLNIVCGTNKRSGSKITSLPSPRPRQVRHDTDSGSLSTDPQGILIRGIKKEDGTEILGSGRVGKVLEINKSFYGENLEQSERIWIEESNEKPNIKNLRRVGVDYAGEWADKLWRFKII